MSKKKCPLCSSDRLTLLYAGNIKKDYFDSQYKISSSEYGQHLDIFRCLNCNVVFENIAGLKKSINKHYKTLDDVAYEEERDNRARAFKRIISKLKEIKSSGKLLDIGCATGALLVEAQKQGYSTYGLEPSLWASKIAREKYHLNVKTGRVEDMRYSKNNFDIVTLLDVIEHLVRPDLIVQKVASVLKKGGVVCIVTPDFGSTASRILGERWWHVRPSHFYYFEHRIMRSLLEKAGFEIIISRQYKWYLSADYLMERFLKLVGIRWVVRSGMLSNITLGINLGDSMEIYAVKK